MSKSKMTFEDVMAELERMGTAQNVKVYKRHGAGENLFGVSFANLKILKKKIKTDQPMAEKLWATNNTDAQTLAIMIADPAQMDERQVEDWLKVTRYYMLVDMLVGSIVAKTSFAKEKMEQWIQSDDEWVGRAGWQLMANLAMYDESLDDAYFEPHLQTIKQTIHQGKNRTRDAKNSALIAIGIRNDTMETKAISIAEQIGKVEVDHGETGCKTPDAVPYIKKARDRKRKKAAAK